MPEIPIEKAAINHRLLKWICYIWFCLHDELPFAAPCSKYILGRPKLIMVLAICLTTVGRGKEVRASCIVSFQELLHFLNKGRQMQNSSNIFGVWAFRYSRTMAGPYADLQRDLCFNCMWLSQKQVQLSVC
uniref:Uncharacterized protein n=1 Tax=Arundo donax TaxID=35708 RepID=A0A0A8YRC9_ARUDO